MATPEEILQQQSAPVAPVVAQPVAPVLTTVTPEAVYAAPNIQQIDVPSTKKAMDMKLSSLEKKLAKASSVQELNQIGIMNQPKAMGVLTGEAAYRDRLDTAKINAFNALYSARLQEEQRKAAEKQQFIATYGADPSQRPKGMSKREFAAALTAGKFTDLLTTEEKAKRASLAATKAATASSAASAAGLSKVAPIVTAEFEKTGKNWDQTVQNLRAKGYVIESGGEIDNILRGLHGLEPIKAVTPEELKAEQAAKTEVDSAKAIIPGLERKIEDLDKVTGRGVGAGITGFLERYLPSPTGAKRDNITLIKSIIGQETLQALLDLKAKGGTLGAISEKELEILQGSATRIGAAMSKDKFGNDVVNMTEGAFFDEIKRMKESTQRVLNEAKNKAGVAGGGETKVIAPDGQEIIIID